MWTWACRVAYKAGKKVSKKVVNITPRVISRVSSAIKLSPARIDNLP